MSGNRTRGLLRAAALLAAGASPLLASAANAAEAPLDVVDDTAGHAPSVGLDVAKPATDLLSGRAVMLPASAPAALPEVKAPHIAAPAGLQVPSAPNVPANAEALAADALAPHARTMPAPAAPLAPELRLVQSGTAQHIPDLGALPVQAPGLP
ncbi:hypothetical protein [Saccharothrix yanglingensis]|uniref:Secreted protein n=1 Tax=Saccharothrix yanglingensis TaxID=659496 RepID=A0ABU0WZL6_9PSEU|nr:hypothetical protein [Saccharothrix yanglingensis]MDQ2585315.1 hypothetical protein [Saccharothrix yanglingensis]